MNGNMSVLRLIFCSLAIYNVSEGRIISGIIGQNVSLSWTFSINKTDAIYILHNATPIHQFFPNNNSSVPRKPPQRGGFTVDYTTPGNITVMINFLDLTENDAGTYRVVRQWNLEDLADGVDLQTTEIIYFTATGVSWKVDTEGISTYTTAAPSQNVYTKGIIHYTVTAITTEVDAEAFPSKSHLLYIVLGMGGILAVAFIACLQHRIRICLRTNRVSNDNAFTDSNKDDGGEHLPGKYWTIVSNERGELSTAIEMNLEQHSEPQLIAQTMVHIDNESEEILRPSNITRREELDGYLNPVHSIPMKFDDYIHPVHSDHVNTIGASIQYIEIL